MEQNYISVVIVVRNGKEVIIQKLKALHEVLSSYFLNFEIVVVDNMSKDGTFDDLKNSDLAINLISLPRRHGSQQALNAGVSLAIGDYVVEIEDGMMDIDYNYIIEMYRKSQEGFDFVFLTPKQINLSSTIFYKMMNYSFRYELTTDITSSIMTLSSRRGQNKTAEIGRRIINRNVSYAICGLKTTNIEKNIVYNNQRSFSSNIQLFIDTLIFHTNIITYVAQVVAMFFVGVSISVFIYALLMKIFADVIEGWASTIVLISIGFSAMFFMFAIISRYLHHILNNTLHTKDYVYRSVDKK